MSTTRNGHPQRHSLSRPRRTAFAAIVGVLAFGALADSAPAAAQAAPLAEPAADPFYSSLHQGGRDAALRGEHAEAQKRLRLACFGFLDFPPELVACLVDLSLTEAALGDRAAVAEAFRRLDDLEGRFGAYGQAPIAEDRRRSYEQMLLQQLPAGTLESAKSFGDLAQLQEDARFATLPERQRREALVEKVAAQPENLRWRHLLADMEMDQGRWASAIEHLDVILSAAMDDTDRGEALCERGYALAGLENFAAAVEDLARCDRTSTQRGYALARADALVEAGRPAEALEFLSALPLELNQDREAERIERRAQKAQKVLAKAQQRAEAQEAAAAPVDLASVEASATDIQDESLPELDAGIEAAAGVEGAQAQLSDADHEALARARRLMDQARLEKDLEEPLRIAREIADRVPDSADAQHLVATLAYRASRWQDSAEYFRRGGDPGNDQPLLLFFMSVAFFESGDTAAAAEAMERCLPKLQRTTYVDGYAEKILSHLNG